MELASVLKEKSPSNTGQMGNEIEARKFSLGNRTHNTIKAVLQLGNGWKDEIIWKITGR